MEEQLIAGAREKQKALDASHAGELQKLVQDMDLRKAKELKELEDGLQRQMQVRSGCNRRALSGLPAAERTLVTALCSRACLFFLLSAPAPGDPLDVEGRHQPH